MESLSTTRKLKLCSLTDFCSRMESLSTTRKLKLCSLTVFAVAVVVICAQIFFIPGLFLKHVISDDGSTPTTLTPLARAATGIVNSTGAYMRNGVNVQDQRNASGTANTPSPNPVVLLHEKTIDFENGRESRSRHVICHTISSRLGNRLFKYASSLAIALRMNASLVLFNNKPLNQVLKTPHINDRQLMPRCSRATTVNPKFCCAFDRRLLALSPDRDYNVLGYLQSWKYFAGYEKDIRKALTFRDDIVRKADEIVETLRENFSESFLVGIHVRRGDYVRASKIAIGYKVAPAEYFINAMNYFEKMNGRENKPILEMFERNGASLEQNKELTEVQDRSEGADTIEDKTYKKGKLDRTTLMETKGHSDNYLQNKTHAKHTNIKLIKKTEYTSNKSKNVITKNLKSTKSKVKFIVACADGMDWCRNALKEKTRLLHYLSLNSPEVDMLILSKLDHVIISVGTFSWWVGYFSTGTVVYYKDFVNKGKRIGTGYGPNGTEWMLPSWIPVS